MKRGKVRLKKVTVEKFPKFGGKKNEWNIAASKQTSNGINLKKPMLIGVIINMWKQIKPLKARVKSSSLSSGGWTIWMVSVLIRNHGEQKQHALKVLKQGQCDGPGDKGTCLQAWQSDLDARNPQSWRRELILVGCLLISKTELITKDKNMLPRKKKSWI